MSRTGFAILFTVACCLLHPVDLLAARSDWSAYEAKPDAWYREADGREAIRNVLSNQAPRGDWPKAVDTIGTRFDGDPTTIRGTFDNGATIAEVQFLARAFRATGEDSCLAAVLRAIDHILEAQYPNGGWPQFSPPGNAYHRYITFNDDTMINLMVLLREVGNSDRFSFIDEARREKARAAFDAGVACILKCQVIVDGKKTVWCAQHDEITFKPRPARSFEPVSLSGGESVGILMLLMSLERPGPEVVEAIEAGVRWFEAVKLEGIRQQRIEGDKVIVADPKSPPLWARFYEIGSNRPIFLSRDAVIRYSLAEISAERRNGYSWYGDRPAAMLKRYARWAQARPKLSLPPIAPKRMRNVLFVYTDDQASWTIGAYGNREVKTPNFDRLAREGALFHNAFTVTPVCSPSRASMMTGRYPTRLGIDDWINPSTEPDLGLSPSEVLWTEVLRDAGYDTMLLGKWHLGTRDEFHPTRQGYTRFFGFRDGGNLPFDPQLEVDGKRKQVKGSLPDLLVDEGLRFLESKHDRPFLLSVHFREPHRPYAPVPEVDSAAYRGLDPAVPDVKGLPAALVKELRREYYASVHAVDRNLGRLLDALDRLGLAKETIVIASSDHGYMIGQHGLWHKGNGTWLVDGKSGPRPNMFDDALRVPLIVRWPGCVKPGMTVERVVSNLDLFPSVLEMVGVGIPASLAVDGRSFVRFLNGDPASAKAWDDTLIGQYDMHHTKVARMRVIRTREWKLVRHFEPGGMDELYHLAEDPDELVDLIDSAEHRAQLSSLKAELKRRLMGIGDPMAH